MILKSVRLKNFRNYSDERARFCDGINVILGENAQGKTNLLEALYYFATFSSFKGAKTREIIKTGEQESEIESSYRVFERNMDMKITLEGAHRKVFVNGVSKRSRDDIRFPLAAVIFAPEHLSLVKGAPSFRRKFLDGAISKTNLKYAANLKTLNKVLLQKAALLKRIRDGRAKKDEIYVWNDRLLNLNTLIVEERIKYIEILNGFAENFHSEISSGKEKLFVEYTPAGGFTLDDMKKAQKLLFEKEVLSGICLFGPQRDRINMNINGLDARIYASQGQSRSAVIALKLSECAILKNHLNGEWPILLLDDILSELDGGRRDYIVNHIGDMQVILSCCESPSFGPRGRTHHISNGKIAEI